MRCSLFTLTLVTVLVSLSFTHFRINACDSLDCDALDDLGEYNKM